MLWGVPIWIYLWSAGMAGGAYFASFLVNVFGGWKHQTLFRLSILAGIPLATIGVLCLLFDLGTPIWIWHFFVNFDLVFSNQGKDVRNGLLHTHTLMVCLPKYYVRPVG